MYFGSVPIAEVDGIDKKFKASLERIVKEGVDMERIALVLKKERLKVRCSSIGKMCDCLMDLLIASELARVIWRRLFLWLRHFW